MKEILLPSLGEGVVSGTIVGILVQEGDTIVAEQGIIEVETDKVTTEVPSEYAGVVSKIMVKEGDEINQGQVILTIEEEAESSDIAAEKVLLQPYKPVDHQTVEVEVETLQLAQKPIGIESVIEVKLPSLGEGVTSGVIVSILVSGGDTIELNQELLEVETDKVTIAVPSDYEGEILEILVKEGDDISEGDVILKLKITAADTSSNGDAKSTSIATGTDYSPAASASPEVDHAVAMKPPKVPVIGSLGSLTASASARTTPKARKLARELNVNLDQVSTTNGIIFANQIKSFVRSAPIGTTQTQSAIRSQPKIELPSFSKWGNVQEQPMTGMMKATARNMQQAWQNIPHAWLQEEANVTLLERERKNLNEQNGIKLSTTVYIIKAVTNCLREFPIFNSSIDMDRGQVIMKDYYNVGVAVDTDHGLFVPVIKNTDQLGLKGIGDNLKDLSTLAKSKKLGASDLDGGNFTISNLGVMGTTAIFPIILPPQVAILGVAGYQVRDGQKHLPLTIGFDHRVINGADAARFIGHLKYLLENPFSMIF